MTREDITRMKKTFLAALVLAVILTLGGRGSFLHVSSVVAVNLWIGFPLLMVAAGARIVWKFDRSYGVRRVMTSSLLAVGLLSFQLLTIPAGKIVLARDIQKAEAYCESLVLTLDQLKEKQGAYPKSQEQIIKEPDLPRILRSDHFYWSNGQIFTLTFADPAGPLNFYEFNSARRKWEKV